MLKVGEDTLFVLSVMHCKISVCILVNCSAHHMLDMIFLMSSQFRMVHPTSLHLRHPFTGRCGRLNAFEVTNRWQQLGH
jgi:hypothetical protein